MSEKIRKLNGPVPDNLKRLLKRSGIKQSDLARALGVSRQQITDIISGRRLVYPSELADICRVFETTPNALLGFKETKEILVTYGEEREVIASITDENALFKEGYEVTFR